jgi:hypothetical protein
MSETTDNDPLDAEIDFDKLGKPVRGKFLAKYSQQPTARVLEPDLIERFPDSASVNEALRAYLRWKRESA